MNTILKLINAFIRIKAAWQVLTRRDYIVISHVRSERIRVKFTGEYADSSDMVSSSNFAPIDDDLSETTVEDILQEIEESVMVTEKSNDLPLYAKVPTGEVVKIKLWRFVPTVNNINLSGFYDIRDNFYYLGGAFTATEEEYNNQ
jgi:hypothetical protein